MAITIFHGDDVVTSRQKLISMVTDAKLKDWEIVNLTGKSIELVDLKQALETQSMFAAERLVVIEELFSRLQSKAKKELLAYLSSRNDAEVVVWEGKKIEASPLKTFSKAKVLESKLPQVLFTFLDDIAPKNPQYNLRNLRSVLQQQPADMVLALLQRRVRQLLLASAGPEIIRSVERMAEWQLKKIERQASRFTEQQLRAWYAAMLQFDYKRKSGKTTMSVDQQLENWMIRL